MKVRNKSFRDIVDGSFAIVIGEKHTRNNKDKLISILYFMNKNQFKIDFFFEERFSSRSFYNDLRFEILNEIA